MTLYTTCKERAPFSLLKKTVLVASMIILTGCTFPWTKSPIIEEIPDDTTATDTTTAEIKTETPVIAPKEQEQNIQAQVNDSSLSSKDKIERIAILTKKSDFLLANSQYREALATYERILKMEPTDEMERKAANAAFQGKDFEKAIKY